MATTLSTTDLMNRIYRRQRHIYDLTRKYFLLGRDRLIEGLAPAAGASVLEIGCGTGRNLVLAAAKYPFARFYGVDISTEMLTTAIESIDRHGLSARVRVAHADATGFDAARLFGKPRFERIFLSYTLSMIPEWRTALDTAIALLKPGGELHIVDFGRQEGLPVIFTVALRNWLSLFKVTPRDELQVELVRCADRLGARLFFDRPCRGFAQHAVLRLPPAA